jgi:hypothetical protein
MKESFAIIASILAIAGNVPYLLDIVHKRVKPHPYTWLVWTIVSAVTFFGQVSKGAGIGALPTAAAEIFTVIIFVFSLQYGFKNIVRTDTYFLIFALLGLIPWALTKDPTLSIIIVVSIDVIAFMPTLHKTYLSPRTETATLYSMNVMRHVLALFSLQAYNIATMLHSVIMIITNTVMSFLIIRDKKIK